MHNALKSNEWRTIWARKTFKIEMQKGGPNNSDFLQNWFPPEIRSPPPPLFNLYNFKTLKNLLWIMRNALISNEWPWIWVHKTFKIQIQKMGPKNSNFLQNWFPQKLGTPVQFVEISTLWENHCWIMHNALKSNEWRTIWVRKTFKIEIQKGGKLVPHRK